jgi:UDP-N-acetylmuramate--alanine ligase
VTGYGFAEDAEVRATQIERHPSFSRVRVARPDRPPLDLTLNLPGRHNVQNALAAVAVATEVGVGDAAIQSALHGFQGIARRFQVYGEVATAVGRVLLVDDYGHHPREVAATLETIRCAWPQRRLVLVFQPHRYTRTRDLLDDFAGVLADADVLLLLEVYAAGEPPIPGADGRALSRAIRQRGRVEPIFVAKHEDLETTLSEVLHEGDVLLTQGAGDIGHLAARLAENLRLGIGNRTLREVEPCR